MAIHDWTQVDAGIFHAFHHMWIDELARSLNRGRLPADYYALPEQITNKFGPDVLTLKSNSSDADDGPGGVATTARPTLKPALTIPKFTITGESDLDFFRRKQKGVAIHHISGDNIIAIIEIISSGNKSSRGTMRNFVEKAAELLDQGIHLLLLDVQPRSKRDPDSIHGEIWREISGHEYQSPAERPFTFASYETGATVRAYVFHASLGDSLPDVPLFLSRGFSVVVPLEATYQAAFDEIPARWRSVLAK